MVSFSVEGVLTKIVVLDMYKALSIQKIRQKYKNADITQDTLLIILGRKMTDGFVSYWSAVMTKPDDPSYEFAK
jgi:hypothetical protein